MASATGLLACLAFFRRQPALSSCRFPLQAFPVLPALSRLNRAFEVSLSAGSPGLREALIKGTFQQRGTANPLNYHMVIEQMPNYSAYP